MSKHQEWKMIHLLYRYGSPGPDGRCVLTREALGKAGVHCYGDTMVPLEQAGVVESVGGGFALSPAVLEVVRRFLLAEGPECKADLRVDYPQAFVVMPFGEPWSHRVYDQMLKAGVKDAGFDPVRGDSIVRVGDLGQNVWNSITQAGLIVAEVSLPNPNVYFELGLAVALGKDVVLFQQEGSLLPADFGGKHHYRYKLDDLSKGREMVSAALSQWAQNEDCRAFGVKQLAAGLSS